MEPRVLMLVGGVVLLWLGTRAYAQPRAGNRFGYWRHVVPGLTEPPDAFYAQVYSALKESLLLPELALEGLGFGPQSLFEHRSAFAPRSRYLCARYQHLSFYVYAGQTPTGLFVSAWFYNSYLSGLGLEGSGANGGEDGSTSRSWLWMWRALRAWRYFARQTLFEHDAALMFQEAMQDILLQVLDRYSHERGLQPIPALERRPTLHRFYAQPAYAQSFHAQALQNQPFQAQTMTPLPMAAPTPVSSVPDAAPMAATPSVPPDSATPSPANARFYRQQATNNVTNGTAASIALSPGEDVSADEEQEQEGQA